MQNKSLQEYQYLSLLREVMEEGTDAVDRTGVGTRSIFGPQLTFDISNSFPMLTTKKMELKSVLSELIWFLEGSTDERRLAEIRYGKDREELSDKTTIWSGNANAPYWTPNSKFEGDLGRIYGSQWKTWTNQFGEKFDQVEILIKGLRTDPTGRRHIISGWNPGELKYMALPACHSLTQWYVRNGKLSCKLTARSQDLFLGTPYNIASYALFTDMIADVCGLVTDKLIISMGDAHIYHSHFDAVNEQLNRHPTEFPQLVKDRHYNSLDNFHMGSYSIENYTPQPAIKAPMAV